jgi:hypothetical protein
MTMGERVKRKEKGKKRKAGNTKGPAWRDIS